MTPDQTLKATQHLQEQMQAAKRGSVDVGVISDKVGGKIYDNGATIMQVAAAHEYGVGVPMRSFLRAPFAKKSGEIDKRIRVEFGRILDGQTAAQALGRIGAEATNISKGAFTTRGYGEWRDISPATKEKKGSSQVLIDTGTLRNSITWRVNNGAA